MNIHLNNEYKRKVIPILSRINRQLRINPSQLVPKLFIISIGVIILSSAVIISYQHFILGYTTWENWTGFGDYTGSIQIENRGKTIWDLLELLIIPTFLALGAWYINHEEKENEQNITQDTLMDTSLQTYIDNMTEFLLNNQCPLRLSKPGDEIRIVVRAKTITVLKQLDPDRKTMLLSFLMESKLLQKIEGIDTIITLGGCDLSGVNLIFSDLSAMNLSNVNLQKAYLNNCILRDTIFLNADLSYSFLTSSDLYKANLENANLSHSKLGWQYPEESPLYYYNKLPSFQQRVKNRKVFFEGANLDEAIMIETVLFKAYMSRVNLRGTNLTNAILDFANISYANLEKCNLTGASLISTNLSYSNLKNCIFWNTTLTKTNLTSATMPDGRKYDPRIHDYLLKSQGCKR